VLTPREEEPQIVVPVADVLVRMPGASAEEVEKLVATPLESKLREVDGVEYVYSASREGEALVTVRFYVGEDREDSLVKVWNKLMSNQDVIPPGVRDWTVKPVEIDDVPIVTLALSSASAAYDTASLRRLADELKDKLSAVEDTGKITVVGGEPRRVLIYPDPARLAAYGLTLPGLMQALDAANVNLNAGRFEQDNRVVQLDAGPAFQSPDEIAATVANSRNGRPVYLHEVAEVRDGPAEADSYTRIGFGPAADDSKTLLPHPESLSRRERDLDSPLPPGEGPGVREEFDERSWLADLNPNSKKVITAHLEPALANARPEERFQFERHGYFVVDRVDSKPGAPVFNRAVTLRDSWGKQNG